MPLPPKQDPTRPLFLAARSAIWLGVIMSVLGIFYLLSIEQMQVRAGSPAQQKLFRIFSYVFGITLAVMGFMYLAMVYFLRRCRNWPAIVAIIQTSLIICFLSYALFNMLRRGRTPWPMEAILLLIVAAFGQMLWHLIRGLRAIRRDPRLVQGFTPIMTATPAAVTSPTPLPVREPSGRPGRADS